MLKSFQSVLGNAKNIVVLTGAGTSAESGIPTFRGAGGLWRECEATALATPEAFVENPSLVWEFYHWRREVVSKSKPNKAHYALAALEKRCQQEGKRLTLITQNIDRLHQAAGSQSIIELHGSLWDVCYPDRRGHRSLKKKPWEDRRQPLVPALQGKGAPDVTHHADIPVEDLPSHNGCLLRPGVVWFGEGLDEEVLASAHSALVSCDLFITIGTSSVVYPAAGFAAKVARRGVPTAEVNLDTSGATDICQYVFQGKAGEILPELFGVDV
ncbi:NAD-dependent protein deacylase sirtuin-5, mitochondrial [Trebouxia sp. C0009 RCD-2024]